MKLLVIDSSTAIASVAVFDGDQLLAQKVLTEQKLHSEKMNDCIAGVLKDVNWSFLDLEALGTSLGPGSFTGLRIAGNIAKTLSYIYNLPIFATDTLNVLAFPLRNQNLGIVSVINAFKNMVYTKIFFPNLDIIVPEKSIYVKDLTLPKNIERFFVVGDGTIAYKNYLFTNEAEKIVMPSQDIPTHPTAANLGFYLIHSLSQKINPTNNQVQTLDWKSFQPLYIRASEAEENKQGIKYKPL